MNFSDQQLAEMYRLDLKVPCPAKTCLRLKGRACKGLKKGTVHFGRRVKRLLTGARTAAGT